MMTLAARERLTLVKALEAAGPDAPTLCEGWRTRHLAAHLVIRERRADASPGIVIPLFAGWTGKVLQRAALRPYADLLAEIASGPPRFSLFGIPGADAAANTVEHFIHTEDVLRAQPGWAPRVLDARDQEELWRTLSKRARLFLGGAGVPLVLARPSGERAVVGAADSPEAVTLTGDPGELLLFAFGRGRQARLSVEGPRESVTRLALYRPVG